MVARRNSRRQAYLRAVIEVLDAGKAVTVAEIARHMRLARETVHRLLARDPELIGWVDEQLLALVFRQRGMVRAKVVAGALRGSLKHAQLVHEYDVLAARAVAAAGDRRNPNDPDAPPHGVVGGLQVNILVPRPPELPVGDGQGPYRVPQAVLDQAIAAPVPVEQAAAFTDPLSAIPTLTPGSNNGR